MPTRRDRGWPGRSGRMRRWLGAGAHGMVVALCLAFPDPCGAAQSGSQPEVEDSLDTALSRARSPFLVDSIGWSGPGSAMIREEVRGARFVAIGEEHGFPQVSRFVIRVLDELRAVGREPFLAVENGPWAMDELVTAARRGSLDGVRAFLREHPAAVAFSAPFELALYIEALRNCPHEVDAPCGRLWGLDQPFGATHVLSSVARQATGPARTYAGKLLDRARSLDATDGSTRYLLDGRPSAELEALALMLEEAGQVELAERVKDLHRSARIYATYLAAVDGDLTGLRSNQLREHDLKRRFIEYLETTGAEDPTAAVVIKMGADHLYRGIGPTGVLTLGSFVSSLATAEGENPFLVAVFPALDPSDLAGTPAEWATPLMAASLEGAWTLLDLRGVAASLHAGRFGPVPEALERLIRGYDLLVLFPASG